MIINKDNSLNNDKYRLARIEKLSCFSKNIIGNLGITNLSDRLSLIVQYAAELLEAEASGVLLIKREGILCLEAGYGHRDEAFQKGMEFKICSGNKTGLTGHIAYENKLFNSNREDLINHPAVKGDCINHTKSGRCFSLLAIPLKNRKKENEPIVGLLRVDNKKGKNGLPGPSDQFNEEDEWLLSIFAEIVVVALEGAELVAELNDQKASLEKMVDNLRSAEGLVQLLLNASNALTHSDELDNGLHKLAEMIVNLLNHTFCRIGILEEGEKCLVIRAAHSITRSGGILQWQNQLLEPILLSAYPIKDSLSQGTSPSVFRNEEEGSQQILIKQMNRLGLDTKIQNLLIVPLRIENRTIGMIEVGEVREGGRCSLLDKEIELVSAVALQTVSFIDRIRQHEITERRRVRQASLNKAFLHVRADREWPKLVQEVVYQATELVDCSASYLYLNHPAFSELELIAVSSQRASEYVGTRIKCGEGLPGKAAELGRPIVKQNYSACMSHEVNIFPNDVKLAVAFPLKHAGQVQLVLIVIDTKKQRIWSKIDMEVLDLFCNRASISLRSCRLMKLDVLSLIQSAALSRITNYTQTTGDLEKILHAILTGVTAGYGMGFNRAALFIIEEVERCFVGKIGIGYYDKRMAEKDWENHKERGLEDLGEYLLLLEQDHIPPTPIGEAIRGARVIIDSTDSLSQVLQEQKVKSISMGELDRFPQQLVDIFQPSLPLIVAPLKAKGRTLGFIIADNKFSRSPITDSNYELLSEFAKIAAYAIIEEDYIGSWKNLIFGAAHKLQHPISTLELYLGPLARRIPNNPQEALTIVKKIEDCVERSKRIIINVKRLTKGQKTKKESSNVIDLVAIACQTGKQHGMTIKLTAPSGHLYVLVDQTELVECFEELIFNALHWNNKKEKMMEVKIETLSVGRSSPIFVPEREFILIRFQDNGPGVPKELKERIFAPFFSTSPNGDGFGLSHVKKTILGNDGLIREVGIPGDGAIFEIFLPLIF